VKLALKADRPTIVVGTSVGLVAFAVLYGLLSLWLMRQEYVREIEAIEPRTSRLLGMQGSYQELEVASGAAGSILREIAYPPGRDSASMAAQMQQDVREAMNAAGMSVRGSQILATRQADGYDRLNLDITAEGNIDAFDEALESLESMRPLLFVESVKIKPARTRRTSRGEAPAAGDPRRLSARFSLFALRLHR